MWNVENKHGYNKTETDSQIKLTRGYQWQKGKGDGQDRGRGLRVSV